MFIQIRFLILISVLLISCAVPANAGEPKVTNAKLVDADETCRRILQRSEKMDFLISYADSCARVSYEYKFVGGDAKLQLAVKNLDPDSLKDTGKANESFVTVLGILHDFGLPLATHGGKLADKVYLVECSDKKAYRVLDIKGVLWVWDDLNLCFVGTGAAGMAMLIGVGDNPEPAMDWVSARAELLHAVAEKIGEMGGAPKQ